ncbi:MAB_1171c family putative transporter [Actinosynnema sp. NPDC050436]|uniref:MAB_1171c family putative transporter n=1 Tax=Actinosynnema sp. NPDC050436 TaxID=3155659 RepID=UPI0033EDA24F
MTPANWVQVGLIAASGLACAYRLRSLRRNAGDPTARAIFLGLLSLTLVFLIGLPQFYWPVHRLLGGTPLVPQLLQHCLAMLMAYYAEVFMVRVASARPDRAVQWRRRLLLVFLLLLGFCYAVGPLRLGLPILAPEGHADVSITVYVLAWQSYLCLVLVDIVQLWWHRPPITGKHLRVGVAMMAAGAAVALLQVAHKVVYQVTVNAGGRLPWQESGSYGVQAVLLVPATVLLMVGTTLPSWGPRAARRWVRLRRYRRMAPLARAVREACPELAGDDRPLRFQVRYQQRVIGIRDALIGPLRPFLREPVPGGDARAEARVIAEAIGLKRGRGLPVGGAVPVLTAGADLDADAAWLARVSDAYRRLGSTN